LSSWFVDSLLLFLIASALIWPVYRLEYSEAWGSIESTFISDARYLNEQWPNPQWQPNWYFGTRFDYVYPPALRYGTAALSRWLDVSPARGYHLYTALLYCVGIAAVYLFIRTGSGSRGWAWWTAAAAGLISPAFLFLQHFRLDYKNLYWMPVRLGVLVRYGEGPHMSAFALLPLALACAWYGIRQGRPAHLAGAAFFSALVVSNNFYGATALAILFPILTWSVWLAEQDRLVWLRAAATVSLAWGLTAFWLTPSFFSLTLRNMKLVSGPGNAWSAGLAAVAVVLFAAVSYRLGHGKPGRAWTVFVAGSFSLMSLNVLGHYYFGFRVMGEPERLVPELDFVFFLAGGAILGWAGARGRWWRVAAVVLALAALIPAKGYVRRCWRLLPKPGDPDQRIERTITNWMHDNLPGVRTMATGSVRFWYNAWHDLPQLGGGSEQGLMNLNSSYAYGHVAAHETAEVPIAWLQATGTEAVIVHDATSKELYHDYVKPEKFEGVLKKLYDDGAGNRIYRVPRRHTHLARVVDSRGIRRFVLTEAEMPAEQLMAYVDTIERGPDSLVDQVWLDPRRMRIRARLRPGESVLVQETFDPYWKAYVAGRPVPVSSDVLGFQLLDPGPGDHDILLQFETPLENRIGVAAFGISALLAAWLALKPVLNKRR
jgi:hypothetical protein